MSEGFLLVSVAASIEYQVQPDVSVDSALGNECNSYRAIKPRHLDFDLGLLLPNFRFGASLMYRLRQQLLNRI